MFYTLSIDQIEKSFRKSLGTDDEEKNFIDSEDIADSILIFLIECIVFSESSKENALLLELFFIVRSVEIFNTSPFLRLMSVAFSFA